MAHDKMISKADSSGTAEDRLTRSLRRTAREKGLMSCIDCGKCTSVCPLNLAGGYYSPRRLGQLAVDSAGQSLRDSIWDCLTCGRCEQICPSPVNFQEFVLRARIMLPVDGPTSECSHGGALQTIMRLMTDSSRMLRRLDWVPKGLRYSNSGKILFFTGCAPYFDRYFDDFTISTVEGPRAALKIMNTLGITPVLLPQERCCGHDLLYAGDEESFVKLAKSNFHQMRQAGVERIVTECAECYHVLNSLYPEYLTDFDLEVDHFLPFMEKHLDRAEVEFRPLRTKVTYHDPCRLGRMSGVIEPPRRLMQRIPGLELVEMPRHGNQSLCCGTSAWIRCGAHSKKIQNERLSEAASTGCRVLATGCPKCLVHLACARADMPEKVAGELALVDLAVLLAKSLHGPKAKG